MRILPVFILSFAFISASIGQAEVTADNYEAKNEGWNVKIEEAYEQSKLTGKPILANFTGSDWCIWCKRLDKSVFEEPEFQKWAEENVILLELDYPRRTQIPEEIKQQNANLQRAFQVRGFPTCWLFDMDQDDEGRFNVNALGKIGYTKTVDEFTTGLTQMMSKREKS